MQNIEIHIVCIDGQCTTAMAVIVRGSTSLFSFRQKVIPDTSITKVQITETLRHWEYKKNRRGLTFEILFSSTQDEYVTLVTCQLKTFIPLLYRG